MQKPCKTISKNPLPQVSLPKKNGRPRRAFPKRQRRETRRGEASECGNSNERWSDERRRGEAVRRPRSAPSGRDAATPAATPAVALRTDQALVVELGLANAVVVERLCALESPFPYTTAKPRRLRRHHLHATASPQPNLQQQPSERAKKRASQVRGGIFAKEMRFRGAVMEYMRKSCARGHRSRELCADCCSRLPA